MTLLATQPPNYYQEQGVYEFTSPAVSTTYGILSQYFTGIGWNSAGTVNHFGPSTISPETFCAIAAKITGDTAANLSQKFFFQQATLDYKLINQDNGYQYITCYYCVVRNDIPYETSAGGTNSPLNWLEDGWVQSSTSYTTGTFTYANAPQWLTPFMSTSFCSRFKVYKITTLKMLPGDNVSLRLSDRRPRMINMGKYVDPTDQTTTMLTAPIIYSMIKGARFILFKQHGELCNDTTTKTDVGTSTPKVTLQTVHKTEYKWVADLSSNWYYANAIGYTTLPNGPNIQNPISGIAAAEAVA